ncbi:MAG: tail fiber domain-containing protein [Leptospiraceae bacterium]|nr:tail fiber domain-containing protein [Leptospiraceae bacterium]
MREYLVKKFLGGVVFALAAISTTLLAVAVTGTVKTWATGEVLSATDLNTTISSLKTAIEGIPNWTKNGTSATYTDGNVGIGTTSPAGILHLQGSTPTVFMQSSSDSTTRRLIGLDSSQNLAIYANVNQIIQFMDRDNSTERMRINTGSGNVGIGTTSPSNKLHVVGSMKIEGNQLDLNDSGTFLISQNTPASAIVLRGTTNSFIAFETDGANPRMKIDINGRVGIGTTNPTALLHVAGTAGNNSGTWSNLSDINLKKNIISYAGSLDKILQLRPVSFEWKETKEGRTKGKHIGFIAQEVEKIFPEWVSTLSDGHKWLTPEGINAVIIKAIQEMYDKDKSREKDFNQKLSKLEEEKLSNAKEISHLKEENKRLQSELLSLRNSIVERDTFSKEKQLSDKTISLLEERLRKIETMQMVKK